MWNKLSKIVGLVLGYIVVGLLAILALGLLLLATGFVWAGVESIWSFIF
ncbi:hypothetical protein [Salmonella enterica]|nr:hypothetical protein [Salmonella enterica]